MIKNAKASQANTKIPSQNIGYRLLHCCHYQTVINVMMKDTIGGYVSNYIMLPGTQQLAYLITANAVPTLLFHD